MKRISHSLSCATCALLGISGPAEVGAEEPWDIDLGLMNYIEQDRNTGLEFLLNAHRLLSDNDEVTFGVEIDTLTGATPNGASASNRAQTFTQASGAGSYQVEPNQLPADGTHMDTRMAFDASYQNQYSTDLAISYDGRLSMEFDYLSFGAGNSYQWDFNQRNTSLYFGINGEYNRVHPVGNIPIPLSPMTPAGSLQNRREASDSRRVAEVGLGLTQILDRQSLIQFRYTQSHFSGYLTDPYKLLSIVDDQNQASLGATLFYRYESRPESRDIDTYYIAYKRNLQTGILDLSFRHSADDWDIHSSALELRYRYPLSGQRYLQPQLRFYRQHRAYFFRHSLTSSESAPLYASADTRLASFNATTIGIKYGFPEVEGKKHSVVAEYYTQRGASHPDDAVGLQQQQDLFPDLKTLIIKYLYSTRW